MYAGAASNAIHNGASLKMLGTGNTTVTRSMAMPMPTTLMAKMSTVRIS